MITVLSVKDKEKLKEIYLSYGVTLCENSYLIEAKENSIACGYAFFKMDKKSIVIDAIKPENDIFLADGILRSALHVAVCNNINDAFYSSDEQEALYKKLGFIINQEEKRLNINKLFESCCCGENKNT